MQKDVICKKRQKREGQTDFSLCLKGLTKLFLDLNEKLNWSFIDLVPNFNPSVGCLKYKINHMLLLFWWIISISRTSSMIKNDGENPNLFFFFKKT